VAYLLWEKSGKPEGEDLRFWHEAQKIVNPPPKVEPERDWVCNRCGTGCYYDGRCGDGPIKRCGCWGADAVPRSQYIR
jgi:hypothetical protein